MRFKLQNALNKISVFSSTIHIPRISRNFSLHSGFWFQSLGRDNYTRPITYIMPTNYLHIGEFRWIIIFYVFTILWCNILSTFSYGTIGHDLESFRENIAFELSWNFFTKKKESLHHTRVRNFITYLFSLLI